MPVVARMSRLAGRYLLTLLTALFLPVSGARAELPQSSQPRQSQPDALHIDATELRAQYPDLTPADWMRYELLKHGPRGYWSPNLDPVTVLGIHARSEEERTHFAGIAARLEHERVQAEVAFAAAYAKAWSTLYPDDALAALRGASGPAASPAGGPLTVLGNGRPPATGRPLSIRRMVFVDNDCCRDRDFLTRGPLAAAEALRGQADDVGLDVYVVHADEAGTRAWADRQQVGRTQVAVTLNPDAGDTLAQAAALAGVPTPARLPAVFERVRHLDGERLTLVSAGGRP